MGFLGIPGLSFSWKRALGLTKVKRKISTKTGVPMTKAGLERKIGSALLKGVLGSGKPDSANGKKETGAARKGKKQ